MCNLTHIQTTKLGKPYAFSYILNVRGKRNLLHERTMEQSFSICSRTSWDSEKGEFPRTFEPWNHIFPWICVCLRPQKESTFIAYSNYGPIISHVFTYIRLRPQIQR